MRRAGVLLWLVCCGALCAGAGLASDRPWLAQVPDAQRVTSNPIPLTPESVGKGKEAYENACVSCHGKTGQGDGPAAQYLDPRPKPLHTEGKLPHPDGVMFWVITNGIDGTGMASLSEVLTEDERWHVINYLHAMAEHFAPKTTPSATPEPADTPEATPSETPAPTDEIETFELHEE